MNSIVPFLGVLVRLVATAAIAPLTLGFLLRLESWAQFRQGPSILQPYFDLWERLRDLPTFPDERNNATDSPDTQTVSWVYGAAPYVVFGCCALLPLAMPTLLPWQWLTPLDLVIAVYLLALARFAISLAAMDIGTPFAALGSSREMLLNILGEPVLVLVIAVFATIYHTTLAAGILSPGSPSSLGGAVVFIVIAILLAAFSLGCVAITEVGRIPIDNPSTHLELTMIQKAMRLEYSGSRLAMLEWAEAIKLTYFVALLGNLLFTLGEFISSDFAPLVQVVIKVAIGVVIVLALFVAPVILQMRFGRFRLGRVSSFMAVALACGIVALAMAIIASHPAIMSISWSG